VPGWQDIDRLLPGAQQQRRLRSTAGSVTQGNNNLQLSQLVAYLATCILAKIHTTDVNLGPDQT